ncbi:uncharacterized protein LY79DRAFT_593276 [Colletotrichum navitas]|uniref:BTB domain-containing protein n=1 Tax=Colletotrichum navitas TaxID=681940 RepID=A0AAD8PRJ7_9PEZI|nr:uncharacterized protein LY79DRAFT_593276 [Colletotrichum navitas]KAK1574460.1 hypothetical protein LY79DRAFT_593276 [Colletotrichum navitas]
MARKITDLDKRGDLILRFSTPYTKDLRICSRTLARASVIFEKMLFGPFKESQKEGEEWIVELPEDNLLPMTTVLAIAHGCHRIVPTHVTIPELFEILVLSNKYSMTYLFRPYLRRWIPRTKDVKFGDDTLMFAWITREIGAKELFEGAILELARYRANDGKIGFCIGNKDEDRDSVYNAQIRFSGILDIIAVTQMALLKGVLEPVREAARQALSSQVCNKYSSRNHKAKECADLLLGSLIRECKSIGIDPGITCLTDELASYPHSVNKVYWTVNLMRLHTLPGHDECSMRAAAMRTDTLRAFTDDTVKMSPSQQEYFQKQAEISGWYETH